MPTYKSKRLGSALLAGLMTLPLFVTTSAQGAPKKKMKLLWSQEFSGKAGTLPSSKVWNYDLGGGGWGNSERQFYTKSPQNIAHDGNGNLVITASRISNEYGEPTVEGAAVEDILNRCSECQFTSSRIKTARKVSFQYGRVEARMKLPQGIGTWPAFWMLGGDLIDGVPWPECGEIDIMEYRGDYPERSTSAVHGPGYSGGSNIGGAYENFMPLSDDYHVFAIEWKKNSIEFIVDDQVHTIVSTASMRGGRWVFNQRFFLILNLAMGGTYAGEYIDPYLNEAKFSVDYIRFYSVNGVGKVFQG